MKMKRWPGAKIGKFWLLAITVAMVTSVQADDFAGSYNPMVEYDNDISDGVIIQQSYSHTLIVSTADTQGHRTVTISDGSNSVEIDTIESPSGDRIYNSERPVAYEGWNLLDFIMVSDGVNKAFALIGQEDYDPLDISFTLSSWSDLSPVLSPADFAVTSSVNQYGDPNLRNVTDGFYPAGPLTGTATASGENEIILTGSSPEGDPHSFTMQVSGNTARLVDPPVTSDSGVHHAFQITSDGSRFSGYLVGVELDDISDVGISLMLGGLAGDVDGNGYVSGPDLTSVITNWGMTGASREQGDLDGDGTVAGADYTKVITYWGAGTPPPEPGAIPEPATLGLLIMGGLAILRRRR